MADDINDSQAVSVEHDLPGFQKPNEFTKLNDAGPEREETKYLERVHNQEY